MHSSSLLIRNIEHVNFYWYPVLLLDNNRNKEKSMYFLYIHAVSVSNAKEQKEQSEIADTGMTDFTIKVCIHC